MSIVPNIEWIDNYLGEVKRIATLLSSDELFWFIAALDQIKERGGRLFILGVGGSAANASHLVNDFRKITKMQVFCPTDNVSELAARINDSGWDTCFSEWLKSSKLTAFDGILVLSVGGGDEEEKVSMNLVHAVDYAKSVHADILGIVGRSQGYVVKHAKRAIVIPTVNRDRITPHTEAFHMVLGHLITSHPVLKEEQTKWESIQDEKLGI